MNPANQTGPNLGSNECLPLQRRVSCEYLQVQKVVEQAIEVLEKAFVYDSQNVEVCESIGVAYGRIKKFDIALEWMDKLLELDPGSILAHTNKSLFLMNQGKIEEAEEEKSKATLKSFEYY